MNTIIRAHIKNESRFILLQRSVESWYTKELDTLGTLSIVDDHSKDGWSEEIQKFCVLNSIDYYNAGYEADTKNGLYWSLKQIKESPALCCVDDFVFGKDTKIALEEIIQNDIQKLGDERWATIGLFACYPEFVRKSYNNSNLWHIDNNSLYALIAHIFNPIFANILINQYDRKFMGNLSEEDRYNLDCCDDIWVARNASTHGFKCFNTIKDYAQHTGMNQRTFQQDTAGNSEYISDCFVGE